MGSVFSIGGNSDFYSLFFGDSTSSNKKTSSSTLGSSTIIGDYALIKSGAYKKLLNSYYASKTSSEDDSTVDSTSDLVTAKNSAKSLYDSANALMDSELYKSTGKDKDGKAIYDMDAIEKAVTSYVNSYNSYVDTAGKLSSTTILSKTVNMTKITSKHAGLLSDIGITVGSDNKLTLDAEKLKSANVSAISSLFKDRSSYCGQIANYSNACYKIANSTAYTNTHASSYTYNGSYSMLGTSNGSLDKYL